MKLLVVCCGLLFMLGCEKPMVESNNKDFKNLAKSDTAKLNNLEKKTENDKSTKSKPIKSAAEQNNSPVNYQELEWTELIPKTELEALLNPPDYIMDIEDGSIEDQVARKIQGAMDTQQHADNDYEKALISTNTIEAMDGKNIEIPGFIVPIDFDEEQVVTSFFLVPYFGACLHMPPPPPNQIIYVEIERGFALESLYEPVVVSGKLSITLFEDQIATSAYMMKIDKIRLYNES